MRRPGLAQPLCEWPLGNGLQEAETLAGLAGKQGVLAVAGLQARSAPLVAYVCDLIKQGYVGHRTPRHVR
jgi:predicted dehydrogenase